MVVGEINEEVDLAVIGGGPGGYTAALRAAQLGIHTVLIDARSKLGGVCLNEGCIPSKALLHAAEVINTAKSASSLGLYFPEPRLNLKELRQWKEGIIDKLAQGIAGLCKSAQVEVITGTARFVSSRELMIEQDNANSKRLKFKRAILCSGSSPLNLPDLFLEPKDSNSPRIMDSGRALTVTDIPKSLLIIGGGYIGLELGTVYSALGASVTVVEMTDGLLPGVDRDLVKPLANHLKTQFNRILLNTKVGSLSDKGTYVECIFQPVSENAGQLKEGELQETKREVKEKFDQVLIAIGRKPNSADIGLENTEVEIDTHGFVKINDRCQTSDKHIYAIGDVSGQPMLAHRAMRQAMVAAECLAGRRSSFDNRAVPAVVFTEPEIAWCGLTEIEARKTQQEIGMARFPWSASGRAMTLSRPAGHTKIIYGLDSGQILGVGMVGERAGELIAEGVLAIETGAVLEDLACTIHPHPTLSETLMEASISGLNRLEKQRQKEPVQPIS